MIKKPDTRVRLQKVIAASGLSSRRAAEDLIRQGQVTVNGKVVSMLGTCIDPAIDHVKVNGCHIDTAEPEVFVLLNKPPGCVTTMNDPFGRKTVADLLGRVKVRVFPVGRLDFDAEGLLLLTNNGLVAQACLHPRYHVPKTYIIKVSGVFTDEELQMLREGVVLEDGVTLPADVKKSGKAQSNSWLEITIREGKKRQIKRMVEACGHRVLRIKRIRFGPLQLRDIPVGTFRYATDAEANALRAILQRTTTEGPTVRPRPKPYLKNRIKPGDTPSSRSPRKPVRKTSVSKTRKPRVPLEKRKMERSGGVNLTQTTRPVNKRVSSVKGPGVQSRDRRTANSKKSSNPRVASGKRQSLKGRVVSSSFSKRGTPQKRKPVAQRRPR
ncbi:pseudouridine synthase [Candidatus Nitronereus thalassa]|uniref:Pseudouridine synthase n=1 Tax=Candidatus Nitronereus thalassa TaxID=3020898 RepID=A0ABU3K3Y9_9BACT|nr:pseudouridine synthase [Candidatus Nitronereus thalassa]MDT7041104.1 pseudouridine synthase [Candidatus Nitronereus thalassa]